MPDASLLGEHQLSNDGFFTDITFHSSRRSNRAKAERISGSCPLACLAEAKRRRVTSYQRLSDPGDDPCLFLRRELPFPDSHDILASFESPASPAVTRQTTADKIADYLHGKVSQAELVDWVECVMMEADVEVLSDVIGRLGLADVGAVTQPRAGGARPGFQFGLRWQDCEEFLRRLGYRAKVIVSTA